MTVGQLREALAAWDDEIPVGVMSPQGLPYLIAGLAAGEVQPTRRELREPPVEGNAVWLTAEFA